MQQGGGRVPHGVPAPREARQVASQPWVLGLGRGWNRGRGQPEFSSAGDPGPGAPPVGLERPQECLRTGGARLGCLWSAGDGWPREGRGRGAPASGSGGSSDVAAPSLVPPTAWASTPWAGSPVPQVLAWACSDTPDPRDVRSPGPMSLPRVC